MNKIILLLSIISLSILSCQNADSSINNTEKVISDVDSDVDTVSYCMGVIFSNYLNTSGLKQIDFPEFEKGINDYQNKNELRIEQTVCNETIGNFFKQFEGGELNEEDVKYESVEDLSYSLGVDISFNIETNYKIDYNRSFLIDGFKSTYNGEESWISVEEAGMYFDQFLRKRQQKEYEQQQSILMEKLVDNRKSMKNTVNGKVTLKSGLQIEILSEGNGVSPQITDQVTVHYTGSLEDGSVFDSSVERGEAAVFPVSGVIPGWTEALQIMQVGSKWRVTIPTELAYGERGVPQANIPPNAVLIFEMELLKIN